MSFAELRTNHYENNVFDTDKFAVSVTLKNKDGTEYAVSSIVEREDIERHDEASGVLVLTERATATIRKTDLPRKPGVKWRLYLSGDDRGFMYSLDGRIDDHVYIVEFERDKILAAGSGV